MPNDHKNALFTTLILMTLTITACAGGDHTPPTEIATQIATEAPVVETAQAPTPTETQAPTPTEAAAPSMENLPAEWQGKIDHIETMTNMDGKTTRVVAIEKLSDEDISVGKKPELRTLEWNGSEWVSYVPQVGLVGLKNGYWDEPIDGWSTKADDLSGTELQRITAEPIYGANGQEIKPGLVADFEDVTLFCGDVIEVNYFANGNMEMVVKTTNPDGDIQLFQIDQLINIPNDAVVAVFNQDTVDPSILIDPLASSGSLMRTQIQEFSQRLTSSQMVKYAKLLAEVTPRRIVFGVSKWDSEIMADDSPVKREAFVNQYMQGEVFDAEGIGINLFHFPVMTETDLNSIQ